MSEEPDDLGHTDCMVCEEARQKEAQAGAVKLGEPQLRAIIVAILTVGDRICTQLNNQAGGMALPDPPAAIRAQAEEIMREGLS